MRVRLLSRLVLAAGLRAAPCCSYSPSVSARQSLIHRNAAAQGGAEENAGEPLLPLPPGRARWPIIGDTLRLLNPKTMGSYQVDSRKKFGPIWKTSVLFNRAVFVTGHGNLETLAKEEARKSTSASFPPHHRKLFGQHSVLVTSGTEHDRLRRLIQPALSADAVKHYEPSIAAAVSDFVHECQSTSLGGPFPIADVLRRFTVRVSLRVLLGPDAVHEWHSEDINSLIEDINIWSRGLLSAPLTFVPWSAAAKAMRARGRIEGRMRQWIDEERTRSRASPSGASSLLGQLLHSRGSLDGDEQLSEDDIIDNVLTLIFAGSDTTASVLTSAFLELSLQPSLERRIRAVCLDEECSDGESAERILEAFLSETQRAHPAAPFTMRVVDDEDIHLGGYRVPKGWLVTYALAGTLLSDDETYPSPDIFDIERWLAASSPPVWAFGGGKRICPGKFLSVKESTLLLWIVLGPRGFKWKLSPNQDLSYRYTPGYFPADGLLIDLTKE